MNNYLYCHALDNTLMNDTSLNYSNFVQNRESIFIDASTNIEFSPDTQSISIIRNEIFESLQTDEIDESVNLNNEIEQIQTIINDYKKIQTEFIIFEQKYKEAFEKTKKDIKTLDDSISFIDKISGRYPNSSMTSETKNNIKALAVSIKDNSKIKELQKEYNNYRKKINVYFKFIKILNNFNISNICSICLTNKVSFFLNPCGHTYCKACSEKMDVSDNYHNNCFICRKPVHSVHPLYLI
jgi:hypothetical protein